MKSLPAPKLSRFAVRVLRDFFLRNNGLLLSGAVAYNALLSLIPLATVLVVIFSQFFDKEILIESITREAALLAPSSQEMLTGLIESFLDSRKLAGGIGVVVLLFFSSIGFRVLENAFAIIFHRPVPTLRRKFWVSALMPYLFIALIALGLIVLTVISAWFERSSGFTYQIAGLDFGVGSAFGVALYLAGLLGLVLLFTTLYKVMPMTKISFRLALTGGATAAALWELLRHLLTRYFESISYVGMIYGSMATTIIVLLTMEAGALIVLLGAQVIADLQRSLSEGTPWYEDPE
ncbi:MAG: YihY/virulence factor BrkB family protein [Verrucomicrobiae bacterium]|nr:YihY/virulence factor BrkB family protein [Verrucomicrobiae bacterium]MCP5532631.1 YihY/virulence factor BrkB family protein [Akkermansiaceae bacterium]MCP5544113.1 YihY/virulence factor BrkB family protein [Akkermansiaceae bacterium]MCP5547831.1 YihY/virulence factor BrkB family protein [Akkermansiaceae bacterium]